MPAALPHDIDSLRSACSEGWTPDFLFFWGNKPPTVGLQGTVGPWVLSQWYAASFVEGGITWPTAEHWMMAGKAKTFGDDDTYQRVLEDCAVASPDPSLAKKLGRQVRGFDQATWEKVAFDIVTQGNVHKFGQNPGLRAYLLGTGGKILVEASPRDALWGIGIASTHPEARNPALWPGRNLLGFALMRARAQLTG